MGLFRKATNVATFGLTSETSKEAGKDAARKLTRLSTLGVVGSSPKNKVRKEQAKILHAEAELLNEQVKAAKAEAKAKKKGR